MLTINVKDIKQHFIEKKMEFTLFLYLLLLILSLIISGGCFYYVFVINTHTCTVQHARVVTCIKRSSFSCPVRKFHIN